MKAIIFDFDRVCTIPTDPKLITDIIAEEYELSREKVEQAIKQYDHAYLTGKISNGFFVESIAQDLDIDLPEVLFNEKFFYERKIDTNLLDVIQKIRKKYSTYLATNNFAEMKKRITTPLKAYFDGFFFSCDLGHTKDEREFFEQLLESVSIKGEECLFIDDKVKNIEVAKQCGMQIIHYNTSLHTLDYLKEKLQKNEIL